MYIKTSHSNICFSKDEKQLFCLHSSGISIRDSQTLQVLHSDHSIKHPNNCEYDMERDRLFIHNTTGKIGLFDLKEYKYTNFYESEKDDGCNNIVIRDGRCLLDVSWSGVLSYFDVLNGKRTIIHVFDKESEMPEGIFRFSRNDNNSFVITVCGKLSYPSKIALVCEPLEETSLEVNIIGENDEKKISIGVFVDYSEKTKLFTFGSFNNIIISSVKGIKTMIKTKDHIIGSVWSKDERYIVAFGREDIYIVDSFRNYIIKHIHTDKIICRIMISRDGKYLFIHYWQGSEILLWDEFLADCIKTGIPLGK